MKETSLSLRSSYAKQTAVFITVFLTSFAFQMHHWVHVGMVDGRLWWTAVSDTAQEGVFRAERKYAADTLLMDPVFVYPGTTIILPAALAESMKVSAQTAVCGAFSAIIAVFATLAAIVMMRVRQWWPLWTMTAVILTFSPYYQGSTPASAVAISMVALFALLFWNLTERTHEGRERPHLFIVLGLVGGCLLATRFDTGVLVLASACIALFWEFGRRSLIVPLTAIATFLILDPFLWFSPSVYMHTVYLNFVRQSQFMLPAFIQPFDQFIFRMPIACFSFCLYVLALVFARRLLPFPSVVVAWLVGTTLLVCAVVLPSPLRQLWYLYPFAIVWEILLPTIIFKLIEQFPTAKTHPRVAVSFACLSMAIMVATYVWPSFI